MYSKLRLFELKKVLEVADFRFLANFRFLTLTDILAIIENNIKPFILHT